MKVEGDLRPRGDLSLKVIRNPVRPSVWPSKDLTAEEIGKYGLPHQGLPEEVNAWRRANRPNLSRGLGKLLVARRLGIPHLYGQLFLTKITGDGEIIELGLASTRIVTTVGVKFIADDFNNNTADVSLMKFHGFGTGATAEVVGNTTLQTEETTGYNPDNTRPTGSQASATVSTNATYTTVATFTPDGGTTPRPITEWGLFSATTAGTLFDRVTFSVVNLVVSADSLQSTFVLTLNSGG